MKSRVHMSLLMAWATAVAGAEPVLGQTTCQPIRKCLSCVGSLAGCGIAVSAPPPISYLGVLSCFSGFDSCLACYDEIQCEVSADDHRAVDPIGMSIRAEGLVEPIWGAYNDEAPNSNHSGQSKGVGHAVLRPDGFGSRLTALPGNHVASIPVAGFLRSWGIATPSMGLWGTGFSPMSGFNRAGWTAPSVPTPVPRQLASSSSAAALVARLGLRTRGPLTTVGTFGDIALSALASAKRSTVPPEPPAPAAQLHRRRADTGDRPVATTRWFGRRRSRRSRPFRPGRRSFRRDTRSLSVHRSLSRFAAVLFTAGCFSAAALAAQEASRPVEVATQQLVTRSILVAVAEGEGEVAPDTIYSMWTMRQSTFVESVFHQRGDVLDPGEPIVELSSHDLARDAKISARAMAMAEEIVVAWVESETYAHRPREVHASEESFEKSRARQRSGGFQFSLAKLFQSIASIAAPATMGVQEIAQRGVGLGGGAHAANTTTESTRTAESSITEYDPLQSAQFEREARVAAAVAKFEAAGFASDLQDAIKAVAETRVFATSRSVVVSTLKPGEEVGTGTPVAMVLDAAEVHIKLDLDLETYDVIQYGDLCWIYYPGDFGGRRRGLVDRKLGRSGPAGTVTCRVLNPPAIPHIDGRAVVAIEIAHRALAVPKAALVEGPNGETSVWTVTDGTAELREIAVGQGGRIYVEVLDGVDPLTEVVVVGGGNLQDGDSVLTHPWLPHEAEASSAAGSSDIKRDGQVIK